MVSAAEQISGGCCGGALLSPNANKGQDQTHEAAARCGTPHPGTQRHETSLTALTSDLRVMKATEAKQADIQTSTL